MKKDVLQQVMGVDEASEKWNVSGRYVKRLCSEGVVRSRKINGTWVMPATEHYIRKSDKR